MKFQTFRVKPRSQVYRVADRRSVYSRWFRCTDNYGEMTRVSRGWYNF